MRLTTSAISITVAAAVLAACSAAGVAPRSSSLPSARVVARSLMPPWMHPAGIARLHLSDRIVPAGKKSKLIYASEFSGDQVFGFANPNTVNEPPACSLGTPSNYLDSVNGFGVDTKGDVMIPASTPNDNGNFSINVFRPKCGALAWQAAIEGSQPEDAYSADALRGTVLVGELQSGTEGTGAVVLCSKAGGCGAPMTNSAVTGFGGGVVMAKNGDCWLAAEQQAFEGFVLVYFKGCTGSGEVATGTSNSYYGGLFIDTKGNLGSIDLTGTLYVYRGCNPACTLVSSSPLRGESLFGGLDARGKHFVVGDDSNTEVDVYSYSPSGGAKYQYSFNNGLYLSNSLEAAHFDPDNKKL